MSNTLIVDNIPSFINEKQFSNLFSSIAGYKFSQIHVTSSGLLSAIVVFDDFASASEAQKLLSGYCFVPGMPLFIHFPPSDPKSFNHNPRAFQTVNTPPPPLRRGDPSPPDFPLQSVPLPPNATSTLFVEGVPSDATEREMAHIFRRCPGFQTVRFVQKEIRNTGKYFNLCFIEYNSKESATLAMNYLQNYQMDLKKGDRFLNIQYTKTERSYANHYFTPQPQNDDEEIFPHLIFPTGFEKQSH